MPIVEVKMAKGRTTEQKKALVQAITDDCVSILKVERAWVTVVMEEFDEENWGVGGELLTVVNKKD